MAIPLRKKTVVLIIAGFLLVGGGFAGALVYFNVQLKEQQETVVEVKKPVTQKTVCSNHTLTQAATAMTYPADTAALETIATGIIATADYTSDVNCLYVVLQYNIAFSQSADARTNLTSIKGLYNPAIGYGAAIRDIASPPEVLEKMVSNLEASMADFLKGQEIPGLENEPPVPADLEVSDE